MLCTILVPRPSLYQHASRAQNSKWLLFLWTGETHVLTYTLIETLSNIHTQINSHTHTVRENYITNTHTFLWMI